MFNDGNKRMSFHANGNLADGLAPDRNPFVDNANFFYKSPFIFRVF
ncbi:hypothetical protein HMPREF1870_00612 [Bacteroidales bacterium KA00344]|nr:hypothetical protein HMPREF1870_00612 [Bacteroidales bacterium KA00344]